MTTPRDAIDGLIERLRKTLAGVEPDDFGGDNLAIFIASELEPSIDDETLDDSGTWKQGAIDACDRVLDAIHAHYATAIDALLKERDVLNLRLDKLTNLVGGTVIELGCTADSEAVFEAIAKLKQERDEAYERAAKVADERVVKLRAKAKGQKLPHNQHHFALAIEARVIADAIRRLAGPEKEGK